MKYLDPLEDLLKSQSAGFYLTCAIILLGILGFLDATYLTILHYKNVIPPCSLAHGCETVLTSKYATVLGVPIALIGSGFYLLATALALGFFQTGKKVFTSLLLALTTTGLFIAAILVYLQFSVIHAFCQYCLASELIDFLLFDCAWWLWKRNKTS